MKITVEARHKFSKDYNVYCCPIALALSEVFGDVVEVNSGCIRVGNRKWRTPLDVLEWICKHDKDRMSGPVPTTFDTYTWEDYDK